MLVEFSIIPLGKGASVGSDVAKVLKIVDNSGLNYKVNPMGTVVEGTWDEVMALIKKCHQAVLRHGERVVTTVKIDDRKGHRTMIEKKVQSVEKRLHRTLRK
ncbi:MAG: MTH1187 family thiamine-binding protein [Nitrospiraceae bacterium]|nr:MAG: MTH1187 family thiamine-binding protein [Nitrospiraceae bacterium]